MNNEQSELLIESASSALSELAEAALETASGSVPALAAAGGGPAAAAAAVGITLVSAKAKKYFAVSRDRNALNVLIDNCISAVKRDMQGDVPAWCKPQILEIVQKTELKAEDLVNRPSYIAELAAEAGNKYNGNEGELVSQICSLVWSSLAIAIRKTETYQKALEVKCHELSRQNNRIESNLEELWRSVNELSQKINEFGKEMAIIKQSPNNQRSFARIRAFYEHIYGEFTKTPKSDLYGKISLRDGYIEPMVKVEGKTQSVREYLESWVESESTITVIGGEPGHGKTSLCWKAMCDFYKDDWLKDKVDNVFCFSLNPAKTDALANDSFYLFSLLSWGSERKNSNNILDSNDCANALIFFDGFDELKEWDPGLSLRQFIQEEIVPFQEETGSHIVVTSRNMAIEPEDEYLALTDEVHVRIDKLKLITKDQQVRWIKSYIGKCRDNSLEKAEGLEDYLKRYKKITKDISLKKIFFLYMKHI